MAAEDHKGVMDQFLERHLIVTPQDRAIAWARLSAFWAESQGQKGAIEGTERQISQIE